MQEKKKGDWRIITNHVGDSCTYVVLRTIDTTKSDYESNTEYFSGTYHASKKDAEKELFRANNPFDRNI